MSRELKIVKLVAYAYRVRKRGFYSLVFCKITFLLNGNLLKRIVLPL